MKTKKMTCMLFIFCVTLIAGDYLAVYGGTIFQVIDGNSLLLSCGENLMHISDINTSQLYDGGGLPINIESLNAMIVTENGVFSYYNAFSIKRTIKSYKFLQSYRIVEKNKKPLKINLCNVCYGSGKVKDKNGIDIIVCKKCKGTGKKYVFPKEKLIFIDGRQINFVK